MCLLSGTGLLRFNRNNQKSENLMWEISRGAFYVKLVKKLRYHEQETLIGYVVRSGAICCLGLHQYALTVARISHQVQQQTLTPLRP